MNSAFHGTWKTTEPGDQEPIANPKLARANKQRAKGIVVVSVAIAAAATVGISLVG